MKKSFEQIKPISLCLTSKISLISTGREQSEAHLSDKASQEYYRNENANIHRGVYSLSETATKNYEQARMNIANYIGVESEQELILTRGTTEALNLIASSLGGMILKPDDEILLTVCEHHSNIVPWQIIAQKTGAKIKYIPLNDSYRLDMKVASNLDEENKNNGVWPHFECPRRYTPDKGTG